MNKHLKSLLCILLVICLLGSFSVSAFAEEAEAAKKVELHISSLKGFLTFSKNCVRDKYSENLVVHLDTSLDLTDTDFSGIPIFCGTFYGNHHTIKGLNLTSEGSNQGLFRYLTKGAAVQDLTVRGSILPEGSQNAIGGIAGNNAGTLKNCNFEGELAGCDSVGGLVGINQVSGIIESSQSAGVIRGSHFVGGLAGENLGIIRSCRNFCDINTAEEDNNIENVELTPEFLMGKETSETVTDLGGIAGTSTGVIRDCLNIGRVGYPHMGYNVGGIAGSQRGYITQCKNQGSISGRKEVGGIAGQMEPVAQISYTPDTLQILRGQLETTSALANRASADIRSGSADISNDISSLHDEAGIAMDAVLEILTSEGDPDTIIAANNALSGSIGSMQNIASSLHGSVDAAISSAAGDIHAITKQVTAMSHTLDNAAENLGGTVTDVSDQDTEEDYTAKVSFCDNHAEIIGDLNVGGIAGAVAWENDKDPEGDFEVSGDRSLNFNSELRAVVLGCKNFASVTAKKRNAGGIAGNMSLGLIKDCSNTGFLDCENADYLGGIVGLGNGFIRSCSSKTKILGKSYIGGIAGQAPILSDCRSIVQIEEGSEKLGSILGSASEYRQLNEEQDVENPIQDNYYLPLADHLGAVDGIDYYGIADSMSKHDFLRLPHLPLIFARATMTFQFPDGTSTPLVVPLGDVVSESQIPDLPQKDGYIAQWDHLDEIDLHNVFLDGTLNVEYTPCHKVAESDQTREDGKPILLAEGQFSTQEKLSVRKLDVLPENALEGWMLPEIAADSSVLIHLSMPSDLDPENAVILIEGSDGSWREIKPQEDGSYAVFSAAPGDQAVAVKKDNTAGRNLLISGIGGLLVIVLIILLLVHHRRKHKKAPAKKA